MCITSFLQKSKDDVLNLQCLVFKTYFEHLLKACILLRYLHRWAPLGSLESQIDFDIRILLKQASMRTG